MASAAGGQGATRCHPMRMITFTLLYLSLYPGAREVGDLSLIHIYDTTRPQTIS